MVIESAMSKDGCDNFLAREVRPCFQLLVLLVHEQPAGGNGVDRSKARARSGRELHGASPAAPPGRISLCRRFHECREGF